MKQQVDLQSYSLTPDEKEFITVWKERKEYHNSDVLTIGEAIELIIAISYSFHKDYADSRFFNNILINHESVIGYDGEELIDTLMYELTSLLRKRFATLPYILRKITP